jgi:hypothetical protein
MLFRPIAFLISSILFTQVAVGHIPDGVISNINTITSISRDLNSALTGLTTSSSNPDVVTMGQVIPIYWLTGLVLTRYSVQRVRKDFKNIVYDLDANTGAIRVSPFFSDVDAETMVKAFQEVSGCRLIGFPTNIGQ